MPATFAGIGAIVLWAFLALISRGAAAIPPLQLTAMAFAVSASLGLGVLALRRRLGLLRQSPLAWLHGVGGLALYHALYFAALGLAPPAEAGLLNYAWPLLIVLFAAPLLGMRLGWPHALGTLLAASGCLLLLGQTGEVPRTASVWLGDAMGLGAAVTWALYSVLSRRLHRVPTEAVAGFCAGAAVITLAGHALTETSVMPDARAWLCILALGAGPVGGAFFLWDIGMKQGDPRLLGTLAYATPVLSTLLLALGGFAPWSLTLGLAACLVATGGLVASLRTATP